MLQILFDGTRYVIAPITAKAEGWLAIDSASSVADGYAKAKKDWDHFWASCHLVPSRKIDVVFAPPVAEVM